jgi:hypothetical protein
MRIYDSTDPRDKVYAALALSPQVIDDFRPDHTKSLRQVYIDEVLYSISSSPARSTLDFLGYVAKPIGTPGMEEQLDSRPTEPFVPTWVPDWTVRLNLDPLSPYIDDENGQPTPAYSASANTLPKYSIEGLKIIIEGFYITHIHRISGPIEKDPETVAKTAVHRPQTSEMYFTRETNREAFLRTTVADLRTDYTERRPRRGFAIDWSLANRETSSLSQDDRNEKMAMIRSYCLATDVTQFFWTNDFMGIVPDTAMEGDKICVLFGGQALYVLREKEDGLHEFIGECYVHGLMDGEALYILEGGNVERETFVLI